MITQELISKNIEHIIADLKQKAEKLIAEKKFDFKCEVVTDYNYVPWELCTEYVGYILPISKGRIYPTHFIKGRSPGQPGYSTEIKWLSFDQNGNTRWL
jgi:hypothetical protein